MQRFILALKCFLAILSDRAVAARAAALIGEEAPPPTTPVTPSPQTSARTTPAAAAAAAPARSDALTLLSVLQREARLVDFLKEDIGGYEDAQIGAAVRDVHRDAAAALDRLFALKHVMDEPEGSDVALATQNDAARIKLVGNCGAQAPSRGRLQHGGWQATKVELPQFTGNADAARIVAPAEVEV